MTSPHPAFTFSLQSPDFDIASPATVSASKTTAFPSNVKPQPVSTASSQEPDAALAINPFPSRSDASTLNVLVTLPSLSVVSSISIPQPPANVAESSSSSSVLAIRI